MKRSGSQPDCSLRLFVDSNLGRNLFVRAVRAAGVEVVTFHDRYGSHLVETSDLDWIPEAARRGEVIVTGDLLRKEFRETHLSELIRQCEAKLFMFNSTDRKWQVSAALFAEHLAAIEKRVLSNQGPLFFRINQNGLIPVKEDMHGKKVPKKHRHQPVLSRSEVVRQVTAEIAAIEAELATRKT